METILTILVLLNAFGAVWNYRNKNYKSAMFSAFACGFALFSLLTF